VQKYCTLHKSREHSKQVIMFASQGAIEPVIVIIRVQKTHQLMHGRSDVSVRALIPCTRSPALDIPN